MNTSFAEPSLPASGALVLLMTEGKSLSGTVKELDGLTGGAVRRAAKANNFTGQAASLLEVLGPPGVKLDRLLIVGLGKGNSVKPLDLQAAGGRIVGKLNAGRAEAAVIRVDALKGVRHEAADMAAQIAFGAQLGSYRFDKYRTKIKATDKPSLKKLSVHVAGAAKARRAYAPLSALRDGIFFARDLVNEPANILYPAEFAKRVRALTALGVQVEVLGEKQMEKLGMNALLGVGRGSARESQLAIMQWKNASKKSDAPLAFVGKGVCFDTGGISLKPGAGMEDMKGDMGGAAAVAGVMHALAARKAKVNAIGVIGLVENMPDADAQRPGDIVTSMSGQTIEILNTDAEGRLVLADALWYTQKRFKPRFMIDLATLTGAIMVALGREHAGLFASDDELAENLRKAGEASGERVWRMPLGRAYDKLIDSKVADMKNIGGRDGGSITAAQFLQRYTNDVPWVHLDVAGMAMNSPNSPTSPSWASGYGVNLLNRLVADFYEG